MRILPTSVWPADQLETVPHCPICDSARRHQLHDGIGDTLRMCAPGLWTLYACEDCDCAYLDPRPIAASIGRAYAEFYTHSAPEAYYAVWGKPGNRLRRALNKDFYNARYGCKLKYSLFPGRYLIARSPRQRAEIDFHMRIKQPYSGAALLDVGCGNGSFLLTARYLGWNACGIEVDAAAVQAARSAELQVQQATLETADLPASSFDVITICHVIEHLYNPCEAIRRMFALLKPGGILWLATPNLAGCGHTRFGRDWIHLDPPRHLVLFTPAVLARTLTAAGFTMIEERGVPNAHYHYPISWAIQQGIEPFSSDLSSSVPSEITRMAEIDDAVFATSPRNSDEYVVLARKPE